MDCSKRLGVNTDMNQNHRSVIEDNDRYILPLTGRSVSRCYVDFALGLCFFSDGPATKIRIEGRISLLSNGQEISANPNDPSSLGPLLILFGKSVTAAEAVKDGTLRIAFEGGLVLRVDADDKYEAWELVADDGLKLVSSPGGQLAYWKSQPLK